MNPVVLVSLAAMTSVATVATVIVATAGAAALMVCFFFVITVGLNRAKRKAS